MTKTEQIDRVAEALLVAFVTNGAGIDKVNDSGNGGYPLVTVDRGNIDAIWDTARRFVEARP